MRHAWARDAIKESMPSRRKPFVGAATTRAASVAAGPVSARLEGLAPESRVAVIGAFATQAEAARRGVLACFPDACLPRARCLGE